MTEIEKKRFSIGLELGLLEWVRTKAFQERRSVAAMINEIVREAKEADEQKSSEAA